MEGIKNMVDEGMLLVCQSRLTAAKEMFEFTAHQWRQPANNLFFVIQDMQDTHREGRLDKTYMDDSLEKAMSQVHFMSKIIDNFSSFFVYSEKEEKFDVREAIENVAFLVRPRLKNSLIEMEIATGSSSDNYTICCCPDMFKHAILNIFDNAEEAILKKREALYHNNDDETMKGKITVEISSMGKKVEINIIDNGTGVPDNLTEKIFDRYITTKKDLKNKAGIGLHIAKLAIEKHMNGNVYASNWESGAVFTIEIFNC